MESLSLIEFYLWVLPKENATSLELAKKVSNLLLLLYALSFLTNRKGCFIAAFLIVEFVGVLNYTHLHLRYLIYAGVYAATYWYLFFNQYRLKILSGYAIMSLFQIAMFIDAYLYPKTKTIIYMGYEFIVMGIHIYIISTIVDRRTLTKIMGDRFRKLFDLLDIGYCLSFCYYSIKFSHKEKTKCH